jgi:hypothetical protein
VQANQQGDTKQRFCRFGSFLKAGKREGVQLLYGFAHVLISIYVLFSQVAECLVSRGTEITVQDQEIFKVHAL